MARLIVGLATGLFSLCVAVGAVGDTAMSDADPWPAQVVWAASYMVAEMDLSYTSSTSAGVWILSSARVILEPDGMLPHELSTYEVLEISAGPGLAPRHRTESSHLWLKPLKSPHE